MVQAVGPSCDENIPAGQDLQALVATSDDDAYVPAEQRAHDVNPLAFANIPAAQKPQAVELSCDENIPAGQDLQALVATSDDDAYVPTEQRAHDVEFVSPAYVPSSQEVQVFERSSDAKVPAGHTLQVLDAYTEDVPGRHGEQTDTPVTGLENNPESQSWHLLNNETHENKNPMISLENLVTENSRLATPLGTQTGS